jgi:hypothetical protein
VGGAVKKAAWRHGHDRKKHAKNDDDCEDGHDGKGKKEGKEEEKKQVDSKGSGGRFRPRGNANIPLAQRSEPDTLSKKPTPDRLSKKPNPDAMIRHRQRRTWWFF